MGESVSLLNLYGLSILPNELLQIIVDDVDDADLASVRLVNQQLKKTATPRFAITYFTTLKVFMSRRSLQLLNDICTHELFGPLIRTISFASQCLLKSGLESTKASILAAEEECRFLGNAMDQAMKFTLTYSLAYAEQRTMAESGEGIFLLKTALDKLKAFGHPIGLSLVDGVWNYPEDGVLGSRSFCTCFEEYNHWDYWECVRTGTLKTILTAAAHSRCSINKLAIIFEDWACMFPSTNDSAYQEDPNMGTIDLEGVEDDLLASVCLGLSSFELKLLNSFHDWEGATPSSIAGILGLACNLETLYVDVGGASYSDFARGLTDNGRWEELEIITSALASRRLRELHLSNCVVPQDEIVELLSRNKATFRVLDISNCCISWRGSWSALLSSALENDIHFDHITLTDLFRELPGDRYHPIQFIVAGTREFEGSEHGDVLEEFIAELDASGF